MNKCVRMVLKKEFMLNEQLSFPLEGFNENFEYLFEIIDPMGEKVTRTIDGVIYDCFKLKTVIQISNAVGSLS